LTAIPRSVIIFKELRRARPADFAQGAFFFRMTQDQAQNGSAATPVIEEYTLSDLQSLLERERDGRPFYAVDQIRDPRTKRKLIDPRSVLTAKAVAFMYESWNLSRDTVIRVTRNLEALENLEDAGKTIHYFADQLHRYLMAIFTTEKPSYKAEVQGLATTGNEMLNTVFNYENIQEALIGPDDLRPFTTYYDHLVNTTVLWMGTFAALNRKNESAAGSIEVWRTRNKSELRTIIGPYGTLPKDIVTYYDIYGIDRVDDAAAVNKKSDLSLVMSGFFAALFHDLGLLEEREILISREGQISDRLKTHMDQSNEILKNRLAVLYDERILVRSIIKTHHERMDGKGYPKGKNDPHLFAQILAVCDLYDEYCSKFVRSKVIRFLARAAGRQFPGEIVRAFLSILRPFEQGEIVDVFEGKGGKPVMQASITSIANRFRPALKVTQIMDPQFNSFDAQTLDLAQDENIPFFI
jgi:hypothetical protein